MKGMKPTIVLAAILVLIVVVTVFAFTVSETQQVIVTQFGSPKRVIKDAGLHFKLPFIQKVNTLEKRVLEWDGNPTQVPTLDKKYIWVDSFARWRITDPLVFFKTVTMTIRTSMTARTIVGLMPFMTISPQSASRAAGP